MSGPWLWTVSVYVIGPPTTGSAGEKVFVTEMSANGSVLIVAAALLSSGLISVPIGADTVAVLLSSLSPV